MRAGRFVQGACFAAAALGLLAAANAPLRADAKDDALLRAVLEKLHSAKSYSADLTTKTVISSAKTQPQAMTGQIAAMKPNYLRYVVNTPRGASQTISDGKSLWQYTNGMAMYMKSDVAAAPESMPGNWEGEVDGFFGGAGGLKGATVKSLGTETVGGVTCELVQAVMKEPNRTVTYAIGKSDHLIHRAVTRNDLGNGQSFTVTNTLTNIKLNGPVKAAAFKFDPPKTAKLYDPQEQMRQLQEKLVKVGSEAPKFMLPGPRGGQVALENTLKGKKAVLVNFWFHN